MRKRFSMLAVACAATIFGAAIAHEGHDHGKVMGTVKSVDAKSSTITVETVEGGTVVCAVNSAT